MPVTPSPETQAATGLVNASCGAPHWQLWNLGTYHFGGVVGTWPGGPMMPVLDPASDAPSHGKRGPLQRSAARNEPLCRTVIDARIG
jgi:hypothetical protein